MKIAIGSDPNAASLKTEIIEEVRALGHQIDDLGSDDPIYPNVAFDVGKAVVDGKYDRGIVMCGTGIGISIAANKVPGVYCALVTDAYQAERAALSNNANVIALGQQVTGTKSGRVLVRTYLANTENFDSKSSSAPKVNRIIEFEKAKK